MGLWDKFKTYMDAPEFDYDEDGEEEPEQEERQPKKRDGDSSSERRAERREERKASQQKQYREQEDYSPVRFDRQQLQRYPRQTSSRSNKVVDIHTTAKLQVVLTKPEKFTDAKDIADNLNEKRTVVLNLESTGKAEARRLLDFLSGVAYANDGAIKKIAQSTFIITPYNVDVMGDLLYELESNGVFFV